MRLVPGEQELRARGRAESAGPGRERLGVGEEKGLAALGEGRGAGRGRRGRPEGPEVAVTTAQRSSLSPGGSDPDLPVPGERLPQSVRKVSVFISRGRGTCSGFWAMLLWSLPCLVLTTLALLTLRSR